MKQSFESAVITHTANVKGAPYQQPIKLLEAINQIRTGVFYTEDLSEFCDKLQRLYEQYESGQMDKTTYNDNKNSLPAYYFGCVCCGNNGKFLGHPTGFCIIDFDGFGHSENPNISYEQARELLQADKYSAVVFTSPSRKGLKVLVNIDIDTTVTPGYTEGLTDTQRKKLNSEFDAKYYLPYWQALADYYKGKGLNVDTSGKNINRACYYSHDPHIYTNNSAEVWTTKAQPKPQAQPIAAPARPAQLPQSHQQNYVSEFVYSKDNFKEFVDDLSEQQIHICDSYEDWLKVGFAIASEFANYNGEFYYDKISQISNGYNAESLKKQWSACISSVNSSMVGLEYVFKQAYANGFKTPAYIIERIKQANRAANNGKLASKSKQTTNNTTEENPSENTQENKPKEPKPNMVEIAHKIIKVFFEVRYNIVSDGFEYREKTEGAHWQNIDDYFIKYVWKELQEKYHVRISKNEVNNIFQSYAITDRYNPILDYIESLPEYDLTDGKSAIDEYFSLLGVLSSEEKYLVKKWFCQLVAMALFTPSENSRGFVPQLCLVLQGTNQGKHKTEFLRNLLPKHLQDYFLEDLIISHPKDSIEALIRKWLVQVDEFEEITRGAEKNSIFKGLNTHGRYVDFRAVGKDYHIKGVRWAVFCATTNEIDIFKDSENRRYLTIYCKNEIDIHKIKSFDVLPMYAEAKAILKQDPEFAYTTQADNQTIIDWNKSRQTTTKEEQYFYDYFDFITAQQNWTSETRFILKSTDICRFIQMAEQERTGQYFTLNSVWLGRILGQKAERHTKLNQGTALYIVYAQPEKMAQIFKWCEANISYMRADNLTTKKYFHADTNSLNDRPPFLDWYSSHIEQNNSKVISLFDEPRTEPKTALKEPTDYTPENIIKQFVNYSK